MSINEQERRRDSFQAESNPVVLDDGQTWYLPKPMVSLRPQFSAGKSKGLAAKTSLGADFDAMIAKIDESIESDDYPMAEYVNDVMNIGANLLLRNYDLADDELVELFSWRPDDEKSADMLAMIMRTARGIGPKASSGGSD